MFHASAWGIPYAATMAGCKLVLPGSKLDGASLYELISQENVDGMCGGSDHMATFVGLSKPK